MFDSLYIFGVSAFGAGVVAYIFFGPSPAQTRMLRSSKNATIRGLQNVKNNCFINSILQSIAGSQAMVDWLNCANITARSNGKLIEQISTLVNKINENNMEENLTPQGVLNALREHRWVFSNEEQDAYELFNVLTSTLENELKHYSFLFSIQEIFFSGSNSVSELSSLESSDSGDPIFSSSFLNNHHSYNHQNNHHHTISTKAMGRTTIAPNVNNTLPTRGILANHLICRRCSYKYPLHLDVFDSITLSLPATEQLLTSGSIPLEACLRKFIRSELIDDFHCESCHNRASFDKKVEFIKLPKLLCFHVQRLVWLPSGEPPVKRYDHLKFPSRLEMDPFTYKYTTCLGSAEGNFGLSKLVGGKGFSVVGNDKGEHAQDKDLLEVCSPPKLPRYQYLLSSVIVHLGNSASGHFICYRRKSTSSSSPSNTSSSSKWYLTSDSAVREVSEKEVLSASAYMLFYERASLVDFY